MPNRAKRHILPAIALAMAGVILSAAGADAFERKGRRGGPAYSHGAPTHGPGRAVHRHRGRGHFGHFRGHGYRYRYRHRGWGHRRGYRRHGHGHSFGFPLGVLFGAAIVSTINASQADAVAPAAAPAVVPASLPAPAAPAPYCREYQSTVVVNGEIQNAYGMACRQPDGSWQRQ